MVIYLDYFSKTFQDLSHKLRVWLICECNLCAGVCGIIIDIILLRESKRDNTYLALAWIKHTTHTCYAGPKKYPGKLSCLKARPWRRQKNCLSAWIATVDNQCSNWVKVDCGRLVLVFMVSCQFLCFLSNKFNFKQF